MHRRNHLGSAVTMAIVLALGATACDEAPTSPEPVLPIESAQMTTERPLPAQIKVLDGSGDNTGPIDVQGMILGFDPVTGDYRVYLRAFAHAPFIGRFRVNINLYNETSATYFGDTFNDYSLATGQIELVWDGSSPVLMGWSRGDVVHTNSLAGQPLPPGVTAYRTQVTTFPLGFLTNEDVVEEEPAGTPSIVRSR